MKATQILSVANKYYHISKYSKHYLILNILIFTKINNTNQTHDTGLNFR